MTIRLPGLPISKDTSIRPCNASRMRECVCGSAKISMKPPPPAPRSLPPSAPQFMAAEYIEPAVGIEFDHVDAAVCGPDLILRSHRFLDDILLDANRFLRQTLGRGDLTAMGAQRVQETHREGRTRTHAGARRQIAVMLNF